MGKKDKLLIFTIFILILSICTFVLNIYIKNINLHNEVIPLSVTFGGTPGFNLTKEKVLSFGVITEGMDASRTITIENPYSFNVVAILSANGNISPFLKYPERIYIEKKQNSSIEIFVFYPKDKNIEEKFYSGDLEIKIKKA